MKLAVSGKGGVGKTTVSSLLARSFADAGQLVLAVDADPDANLGTALGFSSEQLEQLVPISGLKELIAERTGTAGGQTGLFVLNPKVDDIPDRFYIEQDRIRLLVMGGVKGAGAGCACAENSFLMHLLRHIVVNRSECVIVDMEAGLEHLGRGTARAVDAMIVVVEPGRRSLETASNVQSLASSLGIKHVMAVANKVRPGDEPAVTAVLTKYNIPLVGVFGYDPELVTADLEGQVPWSVPGLSATADKIREGVTALLTAQS